MNSSLPRTGALRDAQDFPATRWITLEAMQVASSFADDEAARLAVVGVADLGFKRRAGVKGPGARAWLAEHGIATPAHANQWLRMDCGSTVARLGDSEFVVVGSATGQAPAQIAAATPAHGVYPVPRFDADLLLAGRAVHALLNQTCAFDFAALDPAARPLVMTSMVGVGVTVLVIAGTPGPSYRVWCDGTYGGYLWRTLVELAGELGGGAVGFDALGSLAR